MIGSDRRALTWQAGASGRRHPSRCTTSGKAPEPEMLRFAAEPLQNAAVSQDAGTRHHPDLVERSTLPLSTCGRRSLPDRPWHVSRNEPPYERRHRRRESETTHRAAARHRTAPGTREAVPVPAPGRRRGVPHHPRPLRSDRMVRWSGPRRVQRPTPRLREVVVDPGREAAPDGRHGDARFVPP